MNVFVKLYLANITVHEASLTPIKGRIIISEAGFTYFETGCLGLPCQFCLVQLGTSCATKMHFFIWLAKAPSKVQVGTPCWHLPIVLWYKLGHPGTFHKLGHPGTFHKLGHPGTFQLCFGQLRGSSLLPAALHLLAFTTIPGFYYNTPYLELAAPSIHHRTIELL